MFAVRTLLKDAELGITDTRAVTHPAKPERAIWPSTFK
jgi:hypothetical protein